METRMTNSLKTCPFCGGEVKLLAIAGEPYPPTYEVELEKITKDSDDICFVHCPTCNTNWHKQVRIDSFPLDTIKAWNTRKPMDRIVEQLEEKIEENPYCSLADYRAGLFEAIEIVKGAQNE